MLQKMEFSSLLLTVTFLLYGDYVKGQSQILVSFYVEQADGRNYIVEGDTVVFICQVNLEFNDVTDTLIIGKIDSPGKLTQLATETDASDGTKSVEWSKNEVQNVLTVTIPDISRDDVGDYQCIAVRADVSGVNMFLDQRDITVDILYAASGSPVCTTSPLNDGVTWYHGDEITLRCTSNTGNPVVTLTWSNDRAVAIIPNANTQVVSNGSLESYYVAVTIDSIHDGVTFTCLRENPTFPSNQQLCTIGPLTVEKERPTTLPLTSSIIPPTAESWSTAAMTMESKSATSTDGIGVIAAIVVVCIIVIGIAIIIVIFLVRSGRCASILKSNKDDSRTENVSLEAGHNNGKIVVEDHSHDNPAVELESEVVPDNVHISIDNHGGHSSAEGENYTSLQKNTLEDKSAKLYQDLLPTPRSPNNHETDGDQFTNVGMVSLQAEETDYVVKSVSHKTMNASKNDSEDYEDVEELPGETYEEIPEKCYEEILESRAGISPIPAAAQEPRSVVQHVYLDFTGEDAKLDAPEAAVSTSDQHDKPSPIHVNSSNEVVYANQTRVQDFK